MNFDDFYSRNGCYFSESHSRGMADCLEKYKVAPCSAVDIGAGEGRNSLYLSSLGFSVTAIEPSKVGASKIAERSKLRDLSINIVDSDFLKYSARLNNIGLVIALTSLEHMEPEYLESTILEIKRMMKRGGYIYILVFTEDDPGYVADTSNASECALFIKHYFRKNELRELFSDYEILEYAEYVKEDTTHGPVHYHGKAKLFARKK